MGIMRCQTQHIIAIVIVSNILVRIKRLPKATSSLQTHAIDVGKYSRLTMSNLYGGGTKVMKYQMDCDLQKGETENRIE